MIDAKTIITFDANHDSKLRDFSRKGINFCNNFIKEKILFLGFKLAIHDNSPFDERYKNSPNIGIIKFKIRKDNEMKKIETIFKENDVKILENKKENDIVYFVIDCLTIK